MNDTKHFKFNHLCRLMTNNSNSCPIVMVDGNSPPQTKGNSFYWTTPGGKRVWYPKAYGWRVIYNHSTLRIEVGKDWTPKIPKNMELRTKNGIHLTRKSDGMDLHISRSDLCRKNFCTWVKKEMANNYKKRLELNKLDKQFKNNVKNTFVNFLDARRAGNCCEGIINWAKKKLNMEKESLLNAPWLTQVPAKLLLRLDPKNNLVKNSIKQAYLRETLICI